MKNRVFSAITLFVSLVLALSLASCHTKIKKNVYVDEIITSDVNALEPNDYFTINYHLHASKVAGETVVIDFYALHEDSIEAAEDEETELVHDYFVGSASIEVVSNAPHIIEESVNLHIPAEIGAEGHYKIVAFVDPEDLIDEDNEEDNVLSENDQEHAEGEVVVYIPSFHDFDVSNLNFDSNFVLLDTPDTNSREGHVHVTDLIGHVNAEYLGVLTDVPASLSIEVYTGGSWQKTELWDSANDQYADSIASTFAYNHDSHYFGFDLHFTDAQLASLYEESQLSDEATVKLRAVLTDDLQTDLAELDISNNTSEEIELPLAFFESAVSEKTLPVLTVGTGYDTGYGDASKFRIGFDISGELVLDAGALSGDLEAGAAIGVTAFNFPVDIIGLSMEARAAYFETYAGYEVSLDVFGGSVWSTGQEGTFIEYEFERERSWEEERTLLQTTFLVGPVPLSISAGVSGSITASFNLTVTGFNIEASSDILSVEFLATASGGINLALIEAGVEVEMTLLENVFNVTGTVGLDLNGISYGLDLTDEINAISGKFGLFAKTFGIKWCKKKIFGKKFKYPCGTKTTTYRFWIYQTPSLFEKTWTLFSKDGLLSTN